MLCPKNKKIPPNFFYGRFVGPCVASMEFLGATQEKMMTNKTTHTKYLAGWQALGARYSTTPRSAQRWVLDGRLPPPSYMPGSRSPLWELAALDEHDRLTLSSTLSRRRVTSPEAA
jgi:hypothetical protein